MIEPRYLESYVLGSIDGQEVNQFEPAHPLNLQFVHRLLTHCPVAIVWPEETDGLLPFNDSVDALNNGSNYLLEQPSEYHGRSFQIFGEDIPAEFSDEYGNDYHAVSLKGNNLRNPTIIESDTASEGIIPYGLQESTIAARVIKASQVLASRGISTEFVFGLAEPMMLPWPVLEPGIDASELIGRGEFRQRLIENYLARIAESKPDAEQEDQIKHAIGKMAFYVTLRATDSPYRFGDMTADYQREQVFKFINCHQVSPEQQLLDPSEMSDLRLYINEYVAPKAGKHLALMHPDLAHGFLHSLNITALSGFVDLDSVHGEALGMGDEPITDEDRANDIFSALIALSNVYYYKYEMASILRVPDIEPHKIFLKNYFDKTGELLGSEEALLDYKVRMLAFIEGGADDMRDTMYGWAYRAVADDLSREIAVEYLRFAGLQEKQVATTVATEIRNLNGSDFMPIISMVGYEFINNIDYFASICVSEFLNMSVKADQKGERFNPFLAFYEDVDKRDTETWKVMQDEIRKSFVAALTEHLAEGDSLKELIPNDLARRLVISYLFEQLEQRVVGVAPTESLLNALLTKFSDQFEAAMNYEIPDSQFPQGISCIDLYSRSSKMKRYWRSTQNVPLSEALDYLSENGANVSLEDLELTNNNLFAVTASQPGALIEEVVFDAVSGGNSVSENKDALELCFGDIPEYVLVIERLEDGSFNYRMFEEPDSFVTIEARVIEEEVNEDEPQLALFDIEKEAA